MRRDLTPKNPSSWQYQNEFYQWKDCTAWLAASFETHPAWNEDFDAIRLGDGVPEVVDEEEHQP
jgi:hypothetical protein